MLFLQQQNLDPLCHWGEDLGEEEKTGVFTALNGPRPPTGQQGLTVFIRDFLLDRVWASVDSQEQECQGEKCVWHTHFCKSTIVV